MSENKKRSVLCTVFVACFFLLGTLDLSAQSAFNPKPKTAQEAIEMVVMANRILSNENIFDYLGHVSLRNPENPNTFFISRAIAPDLVTKADILEVDLDGKVITQSKFAPYSERIIHAAILKARPDVNSIVHAHPIDICIMAGAGVQFRPMIHHASIFWEGVPTYDDYDFTSPKATGFLVTTKEEGDRVARLLGPRKAMLMVAHGCIVVGDSVPYAVYATVTLRDNIVVQLGAERAGKAKYMTEAQSKHMGAILGGGLERSWNYYVNRMKKANPDMR
jgi:3-hydroxy-2-methylpyridine-4,5-dicarboxylate 4-decarboxylase